jgi:hypothetical protein
MSVVFPSPRFDVRVSLFRSFCQIAIRRTGQYPGTFLTGPNDGIYLNFT